jgi:hypothetical protein
VSGTAVLVAPAVAGAPALVLVVAPVRRDAVVVVRGLVEGVGTGSGSELPNPGPRHTSMSVSRTALSAAMMLSAIVRRRGRGIGATVLPTRRP